MADESEGPGGPDLETGIDTGALIEGAMLQGRVGADAVLLARVGGEVFAIGATCTHYSGPLAEGLLVGETVRCPWHHACFSLRTGEAVRAPALSPVPCWAVTERDGRIVVGRKTERDPLAPVSSPTRARHEHAPQHVAIIGAGAAGAACAEMLRRESYGGAITMIDADADAPYDRPNLSKDYLAGTAPEEFVPLRPPGFYAEHGIEIVRARAQRLDLAGRRVDLEHHAPVAFDRLLLATGAEPVRLKLPGGDLPHVHYLRTFADCRAIIAASGTARRALVMGASFIGLEVAASLRARGLEVDVVAPDALPLERVMGRELGAFIEALHRDKGVRFHLQHTAARIERDAVVLDDGERIAADLVVIGVGVRPRVELAEAAELATDNGIIVSEYLETSAHDVYAAGDIARWPDIHSGRPLRVEHWVVAERQGQTAARNMLGARERFDAVPFFWSAHYDVSINYVGHAARWDETVLEGDLDKRDAAVRFEERGRLLALATVFRDQESLATEVAMES